VSLPSRMKRKIVYQYSTDLSEEVGGVVPGVVAEQDEAQDCPIILY
jgi:hypothetical protein